jgi:hypothetical protein
LVAALLFLVYFSCSIYRYLILGCSITFHALRSHSFSHYPRGSTLIKKMGGNSTAPLHPGTDREEEEEEEGGRANDPLLRAMLVEGGAVTMAGMVR